MSINNKISINRGKIPLTACCTLSRPYELPGLNTITLTFLGFFKTENLLKSY